MAGQAGRGSSGVFEERALALAGDLEGVFQGAGEVTEEGAHFVGRFEMVVAAGLLGGVGLADEGKGADAGEHLVSAEVAGVAVVGVGGGDEGRPASSARRARREASRGSPGRWWNNSM